jgi:hypothetical protein
MRTAVLATTAIALLQLGSVSAAPPPTSGQAMDPTFAANVAQWTTRKEFISPLVDHLPVSATVPSPRQVLGHDIGAPRILDGSEILLRYFRQLAAHSPRARLVMTGRTEEGRPTYLLLISAEANMRRLDSFRAGMAKLADPRDVSPAEARQLIGEIKPMYVLLGGLHSGETGPPEMLAELAYRLIVEDSPLMRGIRGNLVVAIDPVTDPDGRDRYTQWYYRNKIDDTNDLDPVPESPYWGKYIFHDNNRDINFSGALARNLLGFYFEWHPPIMHDLHESLPFLYMFSGQAPQDPEYDPILYGELPWMANFVMSQMTAYGMPGVWTHGFVDTWSPGSLAFMSANHNGLVTFFETYGNGGATTELRHAKPVPGPGENPGHDDFTTREWYRPDPAYPTVEWSARDNVNYMETGVLTSLQLASQFPQQLVGSFYRMSVDSVNAGRTRPPYGFVIPAGQVDQPRVAQLVNLLRLQRIEVGQISAPLHLREGEMPAGSYIIKCDQPYGRLAKILLEKQVYPDPKLMAYDDTAWTMGLMMQVDVVATADKAVLDAPANLIDTVTLSGSAGTAGARAYIVADNGSNELAELRYLLKDTPVSIADAAFTLQGQTFPAGSFIFRAGAYGKLAKTLPALGLDAVGVDSIPDVPSHEASLPRLAVYSTWGETQNVGWVRYAFDQLHTDYHLIFKDDVRRGNLRKQYDVILIPSQGGSASGLVFDIPMRWKALPYTSTPQSRSLGEYGSSEDIRGGMGLPGVEELRKFVEQGGLLITLGDASAMPSAFGITPDVKIDRPSPAFYAPGPIVTADIGGRQSPLFYGYRQASLPVRWASDLLVSVPVYDAGEVLMTFEGGQSGVLSGLMTQPDEIKGRPAVIDVPVGKGQVLMFTLNPIYRWQNFGEFRLVYNALLNYRVLPYAAHQ